MNKSQALFASVLFIAIISCGLIYADSSSETNQNYLDYDKGTNYSDIGYNVSENDNVSEPIVDESDKEDIVDSSYYETKDESASNSDQEKSSTLVNNQLEENKSANYAAGESSSFTNDEITDSSSYVKNYVNKNGKLPDYVLISNQKVPMSDYLYLISKNIAGISSGISSDIELKEVNSPTNPNGNSISGKLYKNQYISLSGNVVKFVDNNGVAPNYGMTSLGNIQYQSMIYGFSTILDYTKEHNRLPNYLTMNIKSSDSLNQYEPDLSYMKETVKDMGTTQIYTPTSSSSATNGLSISSKDIKDAGARIESFFNKNNILPNYVSINGKQYSMADYLYLSSKVITDINSNNVQYKSVKNAEDSFGLQFSGKLYKNEYNSMASRVVKYIDNNGAAPNYVNSQLGNVEFNHIVLGFAKILEFSKSNNRLPNYLIIDTHKDISPTKGSVEKSPTKGTVEKPVVNEKPIAKNLIDSKKIKDAGARIEAYVLKNNVLPNYVTIDNKQYSMGDFLYLSSQAIVNSAASSVEYKDVQNAANPSSDKFTGKFYKNDYKDIALRASNYIKENGCSPNYIKTNLGKLDFNHLVFGFAKIMEFSNSNNRLPNYVGIDTSKSLNKKTTKPAVNNTNKPVVKNTTKPVVNNTNKPVVKNTTKPVIGNSNLKISIKDIKDAGAKIEAFVIANEQLPNYVTIKGKQYSLVDYLYLSSQAISNGLSSDVIYKQIKEAPNPYGNSKEGTLYKNNYTQLAKNVIKFVDSNDNTAPNYVNSGLGKIEVHHLALSFAQILSFANENNRLPNYLVIGSFEESSSEGVVTDLNGQFDSQNLKAATKNCQVNDPAIKNLALSLIKNKNSDWEKADSIFRYVRDKVGYVMYWDTKYGAKDTLVYGKGNCVDQSHLLIALSRAAGFDTIYAHGKCTFTSGSTYGHVWAKVKVGNQWVTADPTSKRNTFGVVNNWNTQTVSMNNYYVSLPF